MASKCDDEEDEIDEYLLNIYKLARQENCRLRTIGLLGDLIRWVDGTLAHGTSGGKLYDNTSGDGSSDDTELMDIQLNGTNLCGKQDYGEQSDDTESDGSQQLGDMDPSREHTEWKNEYTESDEDNDMKNYSQKFDIASRSDKTTRVEQNLLIEKRSDKLKESNVKNVPGLVVDFNNIEITDSVDRNIDCNRHHVEDALDDSGFYSPPTQKRSKSKSSPPSNQTDKKIHGHRKSELRLLSPEKRKVNLKLLGEISFQLDRRIFAHVFEGVENIHDNGGKRRYYGYSVAKIREIIDEEEMLERQKWTLRTRFEATFRVLHQCGYRENFHPKFSCSLVNLHGITDGWLKKNSFYQDPDVVHDAMETLVVDNDKLKDCVILLICLTKLAELDGQALFFY